MRPFFALTLLNGLCMVSDVKLIVGLGNPGKQYEKTRHNIGFMAIDKLADDYGFPPFREKFSGLISEYKIGDYKTLLLKPQTFMNNSGVSVQQVKSFYKLAMEDIIVMHDELDLALAKIRVKTGGGNAGHNGLRSIDASMGANYVRVRMGIDKPEIKDQVLAYVLGKFTNAEMREVEKLNEEMSDNVEDLLVGRFTDFASKIASAMKEG